MRTVRAPLKPLWTSGMVPKGVMRAREEEMPQAQNVNPADVCKAPVGMVRVVQVDPRDKWPTVEADCPDRETAAAILGQMMFCQRETMEVYDDRGSPVQMDV